MARMDGRLKRLHSRYFCTRVPNHRVFPYDGLERLTEGPVIGKSGEAILLTSLNNTKSIRETGMLWGWCHSCGMWVQCTRKTQHDLLLDYISRKDVSMRVQGRSEEQRITELARSAGIIKDQEQPEHKPAPRIVELKGVASRRARARAAS